jgi:hypothetical protein
VSAHRCGALSRTRSASVCPISGRCFTCRSRWFAVTREIRESAFESFDDYWAPIEAGAGSLPQAYRALSESTRRTVREDVHTRLAGFESAGGLVMALEMLIGAGRA